MPADPLPDALRSGDSAALRDVYERYRDVMLSASAAMLGPRSAETWDVVHDVFVRFAGVAKTLPAETNLRAYLAKAAVNRSLDRLRQQRASREEEPLRDHDIAATQASIAELLERDEDAADAIGRLAGLPEEQRIVVALRVWGEMSFPQIAEAAEISVNTAQSRYRYAMEKLRRTSHGADR